MLKGGTRRAHFPADRIAFDVGDQIRHDNTWEGVFLGVSRTTVPMAFRAQNFGTPAYAYIV